MPLLIVFMLQLKTACKEYNLQLSLNIFISFKHIYYKVFPYSHKNKGLLLAVFGLSHIYVTCLVNVSLAVCFKPLPYSLVFTVFYEVIHSYKPFNHNISMLPTKMATTFYYIVVRIFNLNVSIHICYILEVNFRSNSGLCKLVSP